MEWRVRIDKKIPLRFHQGKVKSDKLTKIATANQTNFPQVIKKLISILLSNNICVCVCSLLNKWKIIYPEWKLPARLPRKWKKIIKEDDWHVPVLRKKNYQGWNYISAWWIASSPIWNHPLLDWFPLLDC